MKIGEIDYNKKLPKKSLFLCRPNKQIIAKINEAYDIQYHTKLSTVNELSFKIPTIIIKDEVPMDNPNIERIKHRYLFKFTVGNTFEYFLFSEQNKSYSDEDYVEYKAYSLGVQLSDKSVREFEQVGNLTEVANGVLDDVYGKLSEVPIERWTIGYVDSYFVSSDLATRKYTVSSMSLLEVIYDIAEKWNAVIKWNTDDLVIEFYRAENVGLNKGFYIRDGKYLESFDLSIDSSSTTTRLRAFGSDGLTFRGINPLGEDYIQDFSFYMYPFEYDKVNNKVIKSSDYMSDNLCVALTKYSELVDSLKDEFELITAKINTLQGIATIENKKLSDITLERILIEDERDILLAEFQKDKNFWGTNGFNDFGTKEGTPEHAEIIQRLRAKELEESNQRVAVTNAELNVKDAEKEKQDHLDKLSSSKNFTIDEWAELQQYIIVKEYSNEAITNEEDLMKEAMTVFKQEQEPKIVLTLNIIDFLSVVECQNDWDKLGLGDSIKIKYDRLKVNIQAKIIEINYNFEDFSISLTIANEKDLKDGSQALMDLLSKADLTSTIVSMDKNGWNLSKENNGKINDLINNKWDALKQAVLAGYDQQITISERGIIVKSLDDPNSWLVIQNGFLAITNDAGNTWKHAISKDGIWGEYIFGKVISGVNLYIEDESGAWKTQGSRTTIYDKDGKEVMWLGLVSDNARDKFDNILRQEEDECFGLVSWNDATKVELTDCEGFAISRWGDKYTDDGNYGWEKILWANTDGTLYARDLVAQSLKIVNDIGETILDAEKNYFNIGLLKNIVADGKLTTLEKLQLVTELHKIHADYKELLNHADKYVKSKRDDERNPDGAYDSTNGFTTKQSDVDRYSTAPLTQAYTGLINYISQFIPIVHKGINRYEALEIDVNDPLMEATSEITDRGEFIEKFQKYHEESQKLKQEIENAIFYSGIHMGEYYNNVVLDEHGFIAVRSDGKYRAYLNATNGLALQKWEQKNGTYRWVNKLYASIGNSEYTDGTLIAEELVAKKLRIETKFNEVLLDMDSLNINFSVLESIVYDDIIASIEKETLKAQWESMTAQYNELNAQINKYAGEVYDDRDSSYFDLDSAKSALLTAQSNLKTAYENIKKTLDIVFTDMTAHTRIQDDLGMNRVQFVDLFDKMYGAFEMARNALTNFLEKSSLQLGRNYNNTIIDAEHGVTVYRGDMVNMVRMNATEGFSLSRNRGTYSNPAWEKLFYVDTDGYLFSQGMRANNLMVFGGQNQSLILDAETGFLDFSKLEEIAYDDVIISSEKSVLFSMLAQATAQYNQIISQYSVFSNKGYSDEHELEPDEVKSMKQEITSAKNELNSAHSKLASVMATILHDVNKTTYISSDLAMHGITTREGFKGVWENFYSKYDGLRNALENFLGASSLQLGKNYNNVVIDENGVTIYGVSTQEGGSVNSTLQMNATVGISLTVEGDNRLWLGADGLIYAKKLRVMGDDDDSMIEDVDGSYISDLTVNELKTLNKGTNTQDIIHVKDNFINFNTFYGSSEKTKMSMSFEGTGDTSYPVITMGAGNNQSSGSEVAKIYKSNNKFAIEYDKNGTKMHFNETDSDGEGQAVYLASQGGIRFHSDKKVVLKTGDKEFIRVVKGEDVKFEFNDKWIHIDNQMIFLRFNDSNYIKIDSSGVTIKGSKINLN